MKLLATTSCLAAFVAATTVVSASIFPTSLSSSRGRSGGSFMFGTGSCQRNQLHWPSSSLSSLSLAEERRQAAAQIRRNVMNHPGPSAMAIPGYGLGEQIFVGGFQNFLQIYNLVITGRILLSWFPQAQGIGILQPIFAITDPYLNLFRGLIPPIFGLDLSPILAFFLLNTLGTATTALGADLPSLSGGKKSNSNQRLLSERSSMEQQQFLSSRYAPFPVKYLKAHLAGKKRHQQDNLCLNY